MLTCERVPGYTQTACTTGDRSNRKYQKKEGNIIIHHHSTRQGSGTVA
jgi:hypothetical protein